MPMLGDILAEARRSTGDFRAWLGREMPDLMDEVEAAAARSGEGATAYVRGALAAFSQIASEEDWARLTSRMRDSEDPGTACLVTMVQWRLAVEERAMRDQAVVGGGEEHDAGNQ